MGSKKSNCKHCGTDTPCLWPKGYYDDRALQNELLEWEGMIRPRDLFKFGHQLFINAVGMVCVFTADDGPRLFPNLKPNGVYTFKLPSSVTVGVGTDERGRVDELEIKSGKKKFCLPNWTKHASEDLNRKIGMLLTDEDLKRVFGKELRDAEREEGQTGASAPKKEIKLAPRSPNDAKALEEKKKKKEEEDADDKDQPTPMDTTEEEAKDQKKDKSTDASTAPMDDFKADFQLLIDADKPTSDADLQLFYETLTLEELKELRAMRIPENRIKDSLEAAIASRTQPPTPVASSPESKPKTAFERLQKEFQENKSNKKKDWQPFIKSLGIAEVEEIASLVNNPHPYDGLSDAEHDRMEQVLWWFDEDRERREKDLHKLKDALLEDKKEQAKEDEYVYYEISMEEFLVTWRPDEPVDKEELEQELKRVQPDRDLLGILETNIKSMTTFPMSKAVQTLDDLLIKEAQRRGLTIPEALQSKRSKALKSKLDAETDAALAMLETPDDEKKDKKTARKDGVSSDATEKEKEVGPTDEFFRDIIAKLEEGLDEKKCKDMLQAFSEWDFSSWFDYIIHDFNPRDLDAPSLNEYKRLVALVKEEQKRRDANKKQKRKTKGSNTGSSSSSSSSAATVPMDTNDEDTEMKDKQQEEQKKAETPANNFFRVIVDKLEEGLDEEKCKELIEKLDDYDLSMVLDEAAHADCGVVAGTSAAARKARVV